MGKGDPGVCGERYEFLGEPTPSPSPYDGVRGVVADAGFGLLGNDGAYGDALGCGLPANVPESGVPA